MRTGRRTEAIRAGGGWRAPACISLLPMAALWIFPGLLLAQVPRPGDVRPELPDFLDTEATETPDVQHVVQIGAFADAENALQLLGQLEEKGYPALVRPTVNAAGVELTRVLAGPYVDRDASLAAQASLQADGWPGYVVADLSIAERTVVVATAAATPSSGILTAATEAPQFTDAMLDDAWALPPADTFSTAEKAEIVTTPHVQVSGFRFRGNTAFSDETLQSLTTAYTGRPISFEELLRLRDELTLHYVSHGYVTSGIVLPEQVSRDGHIEFEVVEGTLGAVNVSDVERLRPGYIETRLRPVENEIINMTQLEERLQLLQQDPLIHHVEAQLVPGPRREQSELDLHVFERRPWGGSIEIDNHQAPAVGAERIVARFWHRNLSGSGDSFRTALSGSKGLGELEAIYDVPLNARGTRLGLRAIVTRGEAVERPFNELDIESETETYAIDFRHPFIRSVNNEFTLFGSAEYRRSQSFLLGEGFQFTTGQDENGVAKVAVLRVGLQFTHRDRKRVFAARTTFSGGLDALDATITDSGPDGEFLSWLGQLQWAQRFDWLGARMIVRVDAQLSRDPLLPLEQFAVGGHATVRGYRENRFVRDQGLVGSIEFRVPVWRRASGQTLLEIAPFYDYGRSWNRDRPTPQPEVLESAGLGLIATINALTYGEVYWGDTLRDVPDISDEHNLQDDGIHFRFWRVFE